MRFLFVHQNMPGQYRELLRWLVKQGGHEIAFLTQRQGMKLPGVTTVTYRSHHQPAKDAYGLSKDWEAAAGAGLGAALAARQLLRDQGFKPDIIIGHTGWGELLFMKEVWPDVPVIGFFEYFYRTSGGLVGFDPDNPPNDQAGFLPRPAIPCPMPASKRWIRAIPPPSGNATASPDPSIPACIPATMVFAVITCCPILMPRSDWGVWNSR